MTTTAPDLARSPWHGRATDEERATWLAVADEVAAAVALDALARDRDSARPFGAVELLRSSGLADFLVPAHLGGYGGHWETAFAPT